MTPRPRQLLFLTALLLLAASESIAQPAPSPSPAMMQNQLDRIEQKLDALLRRLPSHTPETSTSVAADPAPEVTPAGPIPQSKPGGGAAAAAPAAYQPGALAVARPAPAANAVLAMAPDSVGSFAFTGGTLRLDDLASRGVRYHGQTGVELQGWLRVPEAGRFQFGVDFGSPRASTLFATLSCGMALWLEDRQIGQQTGDLVLLGTGSPGPLSLVLGAELVPGLYRMRLWIACGRTNAAHPVPITADILLKAPAELNLRGLTAEDVVHREE